MTKSEEMMDWVDDLETVCDAKTFLDPRTRKKTYQIIKAKLQAIADSLDWISVEDRLPPKTDGYRNYIVYDGHVFQCHWMNGWHQRMDGCSERHPTHWIPLPETPNQETEPHN